MINIAICYTTPDLEPAANKLAEQLQCPMTHLQDTKFPYLLVLTPDYLGIQNTRDKKLSPFYIDFLSGKMAYRSQMATRRNEQLARAISIKPADHPFIVDATAGLGRDSFILASLGYQITLLERSPIMHALLADAIYRASQDKELSPLMNRMQLIHADAIQWLQSHQTPPPDIIYLDPMFPSRKKSASVKKEMAITQELLGKDEDSDELLLTALGCAKRRVVVKRPRLAANIAERAPAFSLTGKSCRFDIYLA